jgi:hypothetical protein
MDWPTWCRQAGYDGETLARVTPKRFEFLRTQWRWGKDPRPFRVAVPRREPACSCGVPKPCERHA